MYIKKITSIYVTLYITLAYAKYACIHDDYILQFNDTVLYTVSSQQYTSHKGLLQGAQASDYPNENNTKPIRFYLDLTYLDSDPGYSCYFPGEVVKVNNDNHTCTEKDVLSAEREEYIRRTLVPAAQNILNSLFMVMPVEGPLFLQGGRCGFQGGVVIPEAYTRAGVGLFETDLVVFVTSRPITTPHVLAFAGQCQEDQIGRAIAGHLNINPGEVDVSPYSHDGQLGIVMHELTHVMGFSFGKFSNFHSPNGRTGFTYITSGAMAHQQTESVAVINTPHVQAWVREHFGCPTMVGAPLENGGGSGTRLSHWEKRVFMNEYMTGEATHNPVLSGLTLAMFADSGWYMVNDTYAEDLIWGKGRGCEFVDLPCDTWPTDEGYHCTDDSWSGCTFDMRAKGSCNTNEYDATLPIGNQYFKNTKKGGGDALADYCPYITPQTAWCDDETNAEIPTLIDSGETYCSECRCFPSSLVRDFPFGGSRRLGCYRMECASPDDLRVKVGKLWYECKPNSSLTVEGYGGHIFCPSVPQIKAVCTNRSREGFPEWPKITSISPEFGSPGTVVTISGSGFSEHNIFSVTIHKECSNVTVRSSTEIIASLPPWEKMGNPAHIISERVNVVVTDKQGRTALSPTTFSLRVSDNPIFYIHSVVWMIEHWLSFLAVFGAIGAAYFVRFARTRELQKHLQSSASYVHSVN